ncbi:hypothetical protein DI392_18090 [Vibrio albus]|uniref:Uncharacterized protein n=1 Tax=Vibrio albus TaxID=2200953 RepID=A0A2U3B563_9VIBR|nr:hypothetical protein [Vibrio albus]PWI31938.1 hypothetical protein DI392_18090 [Vibrio albus]
MANQSRFDELLKRLRDTEKELEGEMERLLGEQRQRFHYTMEHGKVRFEKSVHAIQRQYKVGVWRYLREAKLRYVLSAPLIYVMIIPLLFLDISLTVYQQICFRIYGIPLVKRTEFFTIDRHLLDYLNAIEKLNCVYCSYGNGVIAYGREITSKTEQFWCPIKHAKRASYKHARLDKFFEYGDANAWRQDLKTLRKDWEDKN